MSLAASDPQGAAPGSSLAAPCSSICAQALSIHDSLSPLGCEHINFTGDAPGDVLSGLAGPQHPIAGYVHGISVRLGFNGRGLGSPISLGHRRSTSRQPAGPHKSSILHGNRTALSRSALFAFRFQCDLGTLCLRRAVGNLDAPSCRKGFRARGTLGSPCWIYPSLDLAKGKRQIRFFGFPIGADDRTGSTMLHRHSAFSLRIQPAVPHSPMPRRHPCSPRTSRVKLLPNGGGEIAAVRSRSRSGAAKTIASRYCLDKALKNGGSMSNVRTPIVTDRTTPGYWRVRQRSARSVQSTSVSGYWQGQLPVQTTRSSTA